jgi:fructokinase
LKHRVTSIGEILWDVFKEQKKAGGSSMNVSLNLHKQGIDAAFISAVGNDENGKELIRFLEDHHHPVSLIQTHPVLPTSTVQVSLDVQQQATYTIVAPVAWDDIALSEENIESVKQADAFVYCSLTCRHEKSRSVIYQLLQHSKFNVMDINLRPPHFQLETLKHLLKAADLLKINEDELDYLKKELQLQSTDQEQLCKQLSRLFNISTICVTLGDKGAMVWQEGKLYRHKGYPVNVADTVGAGDAFLATYVSSMLQGYPVETILDRACRVGAYVASQTGANPDYNEAISGLFRS